MSKLNISVAEGLALLKKYDDRIEKARQKGLLGTVKVDQTVANGKPISEMIDEMKANFQSLNHLFSNKKAVKDALTKSNGETVVTIAGEELTVAEAIERKKWIASRKEFLNLMALTYNSLNNTVTSTNNKVDEGFDSYLTTVPGAKEKTVSQETIDMYRVAYQKSKYIKLVDPNNIGKVIEQWNKEVEDFETTVDFTLSRSNALTMIDVELED
jgi:uncharacterized FlaG/YvyC family protein